ncbi:hypothetical protein SLS58_008470 [Diplodia intermedia]|uniref:Uncharacterized protein n=1 Tax=Diplodia intermedia TaxID=856260 RepID=A0ABR3TH87_9PEZI
MNAPQGLNSLPVEEREGNDGTSNDDYAEGGDEEENGDNEEHDIEGRQAVDAEREKAEFDEEWGRVTYWIEGLGWLDPGNVPQEAKDDAMSEAVYDQRYGVDLPHHRLALDIPTPTGQQPVDPSRGRVNGSYLELPAQDANIEGDYTAYVEGQDYLAEGNLPSLLGYLELIPVGGDKKDDEKDGKKAKRVPRKQPEKLKDDNGDVVMGPRDLELADLPILPLRVSGEVESWRAAAWMAYDPRVTAAEIEKRMVKKAKGDRLNPLHIYNDSANSDRLRQYARDRIFRNTVWQLVEDSNGNITGMSQPNPGKGKNGDINYSGGPHLLPRIFDENATRARKAVAKRDQIERYRVKVIPNNSFPDETGTMT